MIYKLCELLFFIQIIKISNGQTSSQIFYFADNENWLKLNSECVSSTGTSGLCKRANDCPTRNFKLTLQDICYFEQKYPIVCCENSSLQSPNSVSPFGPAVPVALPVSPFGVNVDPNNISVNGPTNEKLIQEPSTFGPYFRVQISNKTANKKCVEYQESGRVNLTNAVRNAQDPKKNWFAFVGGNLSELKSNPQMAAVGWRSLDGGIDWKCGGSIVSENFIITAAHCAYDRGLPADVVRVGDINLLKDDNDTIAQDFNVTQIFVHPNYKPGQMYHDIALFKITPNAKFNSYIKPACLWTEPDIPIPNLIAMGYGTDAFAGKRTNELNEGQLDYVANENCSQIFGSNFQLPNGIIESQICAKDPKGKADTCQGDSGGPLVFRTGPVDKTVQHLVGITSFGEFCAGPTPGVYTRVSSYTNWIESIVWPTYTNQND